MFRRRPGAIASLLGFIDYVEAREVALLPSDPQGEAILDELGRRLEQYPRWCEDGARVYRLENSVPTWGGLDGCLRAIEPDWREHVERLDAPS